MEDMKEQARLSGLVLGNNQEEPQWITKPSRVCQRWDHALVVVNPPSNEKEEIIVVLGGRKPYSSSTIHSNDTRSVFLFNGDGSRRKQRRGPRMNERRVRFAGVVCNGFVYAIGGSMLDSIERIQVSDLLSSVCLKKSQKERPWKTLKCRLSTALRGWCSATVVQNRFIIIGGGDPNGNVDILDIAQESQPFIFQAPCLNVPRNKFGMAAIGSRVYVIGGCKITGKEELTSVEYLDLLPGSGKDGSDFEESILASSLSWKMHEDLVLPIPRCEHSVLCVGSCLVVIGGCSDYRFILDREDGKQVRGVEVLDTRRNKVWSLPDLREARGKSVTTVFVCNEILVLVDDMTFCKTSERLPLMDKNSAVYKRLLDGPCSLRESD